MQKDLAKTLLEKMTKRLDYRSGQIGNRLQVMEALLPGAGKAVYQQLYELSGQVELLCKELRETMTEFYDDLQLTGVWPVLRPYPFATQVKATVEKDCVRLVLPEMLPFPIGGSVYYLHEQVKMALEKLIRERKLPRPLFNERCALVYLHHYDSSKPARRLRDYDNVEHRCITNALAALTMWGDGPGCMLSLDVLAPGDYNFTEICILPLSRFREFALSEEMGFLPE